MRQVTAGLRVRRGSLASVLAFLVVGLLLALGGLNGSASTPVAQAAPGYGDNCFCPDLPATRAKLAKVLYLAER
jgi:hypothetical protein